MLGKRLMIAVSFVILAAFAAAVPMAAGQGKPPVKIAVIVPLSGPGAFDGGVARCRATTRKGKACQRTPLPGRDYCPSHQHLERSKVAA